MTLTEIKELIEMNFDNIISTPTKNGWSFWCGEVVRAGPNTSRIVRVSRLSSGHIRFKLAVSERKKIKPKIDVNDNYEVSDPDARQIRELFESELNLWKERGAAGQARDVAPGDRLIID